jgi:CHAD domain-containing protein/HD superfamily phosphodiesterase
MNKAPVGRKKRCDANSAGDAVNRQRANFVRMIVSKTIINNRDCGPSLEPLKNTPKTTGLRYWMARVLEECDHVAADFSADPVHDLRVSLRRCRSLADGMIAVDPDPNWKAMKKAGKRLFQRLGALRDVQIMMEWIEKLHPPETSVNHEAHVERALLPALLEEAEHSQDAATPAPPSEAAMDFPSDHRHDPATHALLEILKAREAEQKAEARAALAEFDRKQWRQWSKSLPLRAARIRPGSAVFKHLALERWTAARELHVRALRNRSQVAFHTLRIGIKRFRYIVENFLPVEHKAWSNDLKHMQDLLGEVHDLDVLWATALACHVFPDEPSRKAWHARILEERTKRIDEYRERTVGPDSLWNLWRAGLPQGKQIQQIATQRLMLWAKALDPDFAHSQRVTRLALQLYDELLATGMLAGGILDSANAADARASLQLAALLHDVGKSEGHKGHHKASFELIRTHPVPLEWNPASLQRAALVARFHAGALPTRSHKALRDLLPDEQRITIQLAAVLRLANALDLAHDGHIRGVRIENASAPKRRSNGFVHKPPKLGPNEALIIAAEGFEPGSPTAQSVAAERYLLETVLRRPVVIKAMKTTAPRRPPAEIKSIAS